MVDVIDDFKYRRSFLEKLDCNEAKSRLVAFLSWLEMTPETSKIISKLREQADGKSILNESTGFSYNTPPQASTPEEIAAVGLELVERCKEGEDPTQMSAHYKIYPLNYTYIYGDTQAFFNEVMRRYIWPFVQYVERELRKYNEKGGAKALITTRRRSITDVPLEITESIKGFIKDHPHYKRNAFIMMPFGETKGHQAIVRAIRSTLEKYGIKGLRSDDKGYHDDLFPNVLTYLWGCSIGIAVFERLVADDFNPNVSLEVGYMRALGRPICLLKDKTLKTLQTDLIGKLYTPFDPQDPEGSIPDSLDKWLRDKEIITL